MIDAPALAHMHARPRTRRPSDDCPYHDACSRFFSGVVRQCPVLIGGCGCTGVRWLITRALGPRGFVRLVAGLVSGRLGNVVVGMALRVGLYWVW